MSSGLTSTRPSSCRRTSPSTLSSTSTTSSLALSNPASTVLLTSETSVICVLHYSATHCWIYSMNICQHYHFYLIYLKVALIKERLLCYQVLLKRDRNRGSIIFISNNFICIIIIFSSSNSS